MLLLEVPGDVLLEVIERVGRNGRSMIWPVSFEVNATGISNIQLNGEPINNSKTYIMAISDYLANGGGGFGMLEPLKRIEVKPFKLRDMIIKEIREITARGESVDEEVSNLIKVNK